MLVLVVSSRESNFGLTKRCACLICEFGFTLWRVLLIVRNIVSWFLYLFMLAM